MCDKPEFKTGLECPSCQSTDTVAIASDESCVGWCSCGMVWIVKTDTPYGKADEMKLVYSFFGEDFFEEAVAKMEVAT